MKYHDTELQMHKAALAGDAKAKRTLEARDLLDKADKRAAELRDKAVAGDAAAMNALRQLASGQPGVSIAAPSGSTGSDLAVAKSAAVAGERARIAKVFGSPHSKGRERACVSILIANEGWPADTIIAKLPNISTDDENDRKAKQARSDRIGAIWQRAFAANAKGGVR